MELPKNITQIGEVGKDCKIYLEDYVFTYMKQLNQVAADKNIAVALYGKRETENGVAYNFVYGACRLEYLQREVRHLSQAQQQEIERLRKKYFSELNFMGYRILNGEMIEGLHLCEQDICRYIGGYARFYEKNNAMLAYMLDVRDAAEPERIDRTKYEEVKKRQDERRENEEIKKGNIIPFGKSEKTSTNLHKMQLAAVGAFALLCLWGIGTMREEEIASGQTEPVNATVASSNVEQTDTLLMEDKLEKALLEENQTVQTGESASVAQSEEVEATNPMKETEEPEEQVEPDPVEEVSAIEQEPVAYIIQPNDTLIEICVRQYGNDGRVDEVCSLNEITNPDDIKEGQIIMLPQ